MKRRSIVALCLVAVVAAAIAAATSGATKKATASSITVWLQVDAQTGWPDRRRRSEPAVPVRPSRRDRQRPVPELGRSPAEVRRHARGRRRARRDRDGQHRDDEVHGGRRVRRPDLVEGLVRQLGQLAQGPRQVGRLSAGRRTASRTTRARVSSPTAPTSSRSAGIAKLPATTAQYVADAKKLLAKNPQKGFSPVYIAGDDWYVGDGLRLRLRRRNRTAASAASGRVCSPRRSRSRA